MKRYISLTEMVLAAPITAAEFREDGGGKVNFRHPDGYPYVTMTVPPGFKLPNTEPRMNYDGGDYVISRSGALSWMPKVQFEATFVLHPAELVPVSRTRVGDMIPDVFVRDAKGEEVRMDLVDRVQAEAEKREVEIKEAHAARYVATNQMREAFRVTPETRESNRTWPSWMHEAWNKSPEEGGALYPSTDHKSDGKDNLCLRTSIRADGNGGQVLKIGWGDYVVRDGMGRLDVLDAKSFESFYVQVTTHPLSSD